MKKTLLLSVAILLGSMGFAQVECNIANMQGGIAGGFLDWIPGDEALAAFIDPADDYAIGESCGATYPYTIESVGFSLGAATAFGPDAGDGLGSFSYQINIYDVSGADPCNAPGALLASSGPINVEMDGTPQTPQTIAFDLEVNDAFFVSFEPLTWSGEVDETPTIFWDATTIPECLQYYTNDNGETWFDWTLVLDGTGWADFNIIGSSESSSGNECEAGTIEDTTALTLCPDEEGVFSVGGTQEVPFGGGYALFFNPTTGTGGPGAAFNLSGVSLPYTFDAGLGGLWDLNDLPPFEGEWEIYGRVYENPDSVGTTICSETEDFILVNFLTEGDEACESETTNDVCEEATPVSEGTHTYDPITGTGATDACHESFFPPTGAQWFVYTPAEDGLVLIRACDGVDTRLSIHTGECTDLTCYDSNDDSLDETCHPDGFASAVEDLPVFAGEDYYIEWDDAWSADGSEWEIIWMPLPECDAPVATAELDFSDCPAATFGITVDLTSIGDATSVDIVENVNGGGETVVHDDVTVLDVYDLGPYNFGDEVDVMVIHNDDPACNIDFDTFSPGGCPPANDLCEDAIAIDCDDTVSGNTENASIYADVCVGNNVAPGIWYTFTGSNSEDPEADPGTPGDVVTLSTCNQAEYDTKIDVFFGSCGELECIGGNDDGTVGGVDCEDFSSHLIMATEVGVTYYVYISGWGETSFGAFDLSMTCVPAPDCNAGEIADTSPQTLCPGDTAVFDIMADSETISEGYEYALYFVPTTGTGALDGPFHLTGLGGLPYTYDNDLGGALSGGGYPAFEGEWEIYGTVVSTEGDPSTTECGITAQSILVDFLTSADEECAPGPGEPCEVFAEGPWTDLNTAWDGAPCDDGDGCPFLEFTDFQVYQSEAYLIDNIQMGGSYTFSHCNGASGSWIPEYTIIAPSGAIDAFGAGDGDGCSITWTATESGTYTIGINEAGACGVGGTTDNGFPAMTCNGENVECPSPTEWCDDFAAGPWNDFNTQFEGAPTPDGDGNCEFFEIDAFEVYQSEAYLMDNITEGVTYTFSHCNGASGSWIPEYTIIAPSGAVDAYGAGDGDGCSITWTATETGTYTIGINEAGACGVGGSTDNGFPAITCSGSVSVEETETLDFSVFPNPNNGQFAIDFNGESGMAQIEVLTVSGKAVHSEQQMMTKGTRLDIDLGNVNGLYFVRLTMDQNTKVLKVIVQ